MSNVEGRKILEPRTSDASNTPLIEPDDEWVLKLLGGETHDGLAITNDTMKKAMKFAGCDSNEKDYDNILELAGAKRNTMRAIRFHGMRMMLYLAKHNLLETDEDPVQWISGVLADGGYNIPYWADKEEEGKRIKRSEIL